MWDISVVPTGYVKSNGLSGVACTNSAYRFKQTGNHFSLTCQIPNDARHFQTRSDSWRCSLQKIIHTIRTLSALRRNPLRSAVSGDNVNQRGDNVPLWGNSTPKTKLIQWLCPRPGYQDESSNLRATAACERSSYGDAGPREFSNGESGQYRQVPAAR